MSHAQNAALVNRLKRANGHLATIVTMVQAERDGIEVAQQLQAVIGALEKAKTALVTDHIEHHLLSVAGSLSDEDRQKLKSLSEFARYL